MKKSDIKILWLIVLSLIFLLSITYHLSPITSFAQCQPPNDRNQGLISATGNVTGVFGNLEQVCITGTQDASYRAFKVPSYENLEDQFFTLSRASARKGTNVLSGSDWRFDGAAAGNGIYLQTNNVVLNSVNTGSGTQVIFIRGSLDIAGNIDYADTDPNSGLVFIVSGNINIAPSVTKINAVLISTGFICTAMNFSNGICYDGQTDMDQLIINGSLISLNKNNLSESAIKLGRNLTLNNQPSEVVKKQPKYLYNLRNGLLTKDLIITTEDQRYQITAAGAPSPSPSSAPPPGPVICSPIPNPSGVDNQTIQGCISI